MVINMNFNKIDFDNWNRGEHFKHFINDVRCVVCVTGEIDVTRLVHSIKKNEYRFYPVFIYIVSKIVNSRNEFKMGYDDEGTPGFWKSVSPSYTIFNEETQTFMPICTEWNENFTEFYHDVILMMELNKDNHGFNSQNTPKNTFDISCIPWMNYKSFSMNIDGGGSYLAPIITWGKYEWKFDKTEEKLTMPLTIQIHHASADGFHIARFFQEIQELSDNIADIN